MDAEVQAFIDKQAEKAAHKEAVMVALGEAKLAEWQGRDASAYWDTVISRGINGDEGKAFAEMAEMAEAYVAAHEAEFAAFEHFVVSDNPTLADEGHRKLVALIDNLRQTGSDELCAKLTMFELVRFERQNIGGEAHIRVRRML